jgi:nucleotide-binding universal stress UspA family protein
MAQELKRVHDKSGQGDAAAAESTNGLLRRARMLSQKWAGRLDEFKLPCPLCRGELQFQGVYRDHLYEFAEGEPGSVHEFDVLPISFVCNQCGYTAEFDADLFNPAYLAQLQGASPDRISELKVRDYHVLVPLDGGEESHTLLDLATAVSGVHGGDALIFDAAREEGQSLVLREKLHRYTPAVGNPAPIRLTNQRFDSLGEGLLRVAKRESCRLLMLDTGWSTRNPQERVATIIRPVLRESICHVAVVHDRGLRAVNRILLATAGGPGARAAGQLAADLAVAFHAELHLLNVASPDNPNAEADGRERIQQTLHQVVIPEGSRLREHVAVSADPVQAIVQEAASYDLLLLGDSPRDWRGHVRLESISAKTARNADPTSIVFLAKETQIQSWFGRLFD